MTQFALQLDLFEPITEESALREELRLLRESQDKLRRGLFRRNGELAKHVVTLSASIDLLQMELVRLRAMVQPDTVY